MDAGAWDERYRSAERVWSVEPNVWVVRELAGLEPGRALDLAAGEGRNALWLADRGWRVDALDFSPVAVGRIKDAAAGRAVKAAVADVTRYEPEQGAYDLVLLSYLHLPRPEAEKVLQSAARAARPGGTLLLVGHDADNLEHGTGGPQDPGVLTSVESVRAVWDQWADIVVAEVAQRPVDTAVALDTVVRAVRR
ncbi:class I SAM-dependent methyltransferase [Streptomyces broussonetiae]|uniref:Methyltransferase domain-containing protein n=1 Tax=Streptomyces broussonetiae TaxID=2686304 RepID=A0A6I6NJY7_9ACTN|nr:class I SAM-dependent methyltransferase [Streptomyces broussonetiae]QHA08456.1 methyltransferase domain-containing protein [Streptomyces broussonetiae]